MERRFDSRKPMQVGGQAVLEGVMMRAPGIVATAVRRPNGEIVVKKERYVGFGEKHPILKLPVLRGTLGLVEMMAIGMRTLNFSAEIAMLEDDQAGDSSAGARDSFVFSRGNLMLVAAVGMAFATGVAVFFVTPLLITTFFFPFDQDPLLFNLVAGTIRVAFLVLYLIALTASKDIRRVFQYHGAEHMAVFAFEKGEGLITEAAARQSRFHPRCGTSFLLVVMVVSVLLFSLVDGLVATWIGKLTLATRVATHLPLIPLVGGVSYELIKASAQRSTTRMGRIVVAPGLWLQKITTQPPDLSQLEVALAALRCALGEDFEVGHSVKLLAVEEETGSYA